MLTEQQYKDVIVHMAWRSMIEHQMLTNQQTQLQQQSGVIQDLQKQFASPVVPEQEP